MKKSTKYEIIRGSDRFGPFIESLSFERLSLGVRLPSRMQLQITTQASGWSQHGPLNLTRAPLGKGIFLSPSRFFDSSKTSSDTEAKLSVPYSASI